MLDSVAKEHMLDSVAKDPMLDSIAKDPMLDWAAYQDVRMDTWPVTPQEQGYAPTPSRFSPSAWVLLNHFFFLHPQIFASFQLGAAECSDRSSFVFTSTELGKPGNLLDRFAQLRPNQAPR